MSPVERAHWDEVVRRGRQQDAFRAALRAALAARGADLVTASIARDEGGRLFVVSVVDATGAIGTYHARVPDGVDGFAEDTARRVARAWTPPRAPPYTAPMRWTIERAVRYGGSLSLAVAFRSDGGDAPPVVRSYDVPAAWSAKEVAAYCGEKARALAEHDAERAAKEAAAGADADLVGLTGVAE